MVLVAWRCYPDVLVSRVTSGLHGGWNLAWIRVVHYMNANRNVWECINLSWRKDGGILQCHLHAETAHWMCEMLCRLTGVGSLWCPVNDGLQIWGAGRVGIQRRKVRNLLEFSPRWIHLSFYVHRWTVCIFSGYLERRGLICSLLLDLWYIGPELHVCPPEYKTSECSR